MVKKLQALRAKKGFTLVELIVVIAIIGVLAAILVPTMMNVVTKARVSSADQTAKSIADSVTQWLADLEANRGSIPDGVISLGFSSTEEDGKDATKFAVTYEGDAVYKRNGKDVDGNTANTLLSDDLTTNYNFGGKEKARVFIKNKHVVGVAYTDDDAVLDAFTAEVFEEQVCQWDSSSREGISKNNHIIGTNPKVLHSASATVIPDPKNS